MYVSHMDLRGESYVDHMKSIGPINVPRSCDLSVQSIIKPQLCQPLSDTSQTGHCALTVSQI